MSRKLLLVILGIVVILALAGPFVAISADNSKPEQQTPSIDRASLTAKRFLDSSVNADGLVTGGSGAQFHNQSLALLVAAATADRSRVDAIWAWTVKDLGTSETTFLASAAGGTKAPAAPADVLRAARSFLVASQRLNDPVYEARAVTLSNAVLAASYKALGAGTGVLVPQLDTAIDPLVLPAGLVSLSDADAFARATGDQRWTAVHAFDSQLLGLLVKGDKVSLPTSKLTTNASGSALSTNPSHYEKDARVLPLELATSCQPGDVDVAKRLWTVLRKSRETRVASVLDENGDVIDSTPSARSAVAAAAAAKAAGESLQSLQLLDQADAIDTKTPTFDESAWTAIGRIALTTDWLGTCAPS